MASLDRTRYTCRMPLISIISACYNGASTLERLLDSIARQTFRDFEVIIADGGSTDGTQEILSRHNHMISWWASEPDRGIADAWNKGLAHAQGEWVLFIGVDDALYDEGVLAQMAPHLRGARTDLVYGMWQFERGPFDGKTMGQPFDIVRFRRSMTLPHIATFHARKLFDEVGPYDLDFPIAADYELLLRKRDLTATFVPVIVSRMNSAETTSTRNPVNSFWDSARAQHKNRTRSLPAIGLRFLREVAYNYAVRFKLIRR